jgi:hypothetical protein
VETTGRREGEEGEDSHALVSKHPQNPFLLSSLDSLSLFVLVREGGAHMVCVVFHVIRRCPNPKLGF